MRSVGWYVRKTAPFMAVIITGVLGYILLAPFLIPFVFPRYSNSIPYTQVLAIGFIFTSFYTPLLSILKAKREIGKLHTMNHFNIFFDLVISVPAIYFFGIWGLILTATVKKLLTVLLSIRLVYS